MEPTSIEEALTAAETAVASGDGLAGTGFWSAVSIVKAEPELVDRYAARIAAVDRAAFEDWALLKIPVVVGTTLAVLATIVGLVLIGVSYYIGGEILTAMVFYVGMAILLVTTHGLGHLVVGRAVGIRFTHWFIGAVARPQPGVKVDYASYLRTSPTARAWMHASGALVTKAIPLALIGAAIAADLPVWSVWGLVAISLVTILTDVLWSTKSSDWAKFKRERRFAQSS
ncbi:MAG: hypothetical protein PVG83_03650 [Acidimicrobiia bacterium]|jgi:hypothetical protein